jgi:hypothetical protein
MVDAPYIECRRSSAQLDEETSNYASLAQQNSFGQEVCGDCEKKSVINMI